MLVNLTAYTFMLGLATTNKTIIQLQIYVVTAVQSCSLSLLVMKKFKIYRLLDSMAKTISMVLI